MKADQNVAVIGAGIIGVNIALCLAREGCKVTLIDRLNPGQGCSFGNAGLLARSSIYPLSDFRTLLQIPGMLIDPMGPLSIQLSYLLKVLPWLAKFLASGLFQDKEKVSAGLHLLTDPAVELYHQLVKDAGQPELVRRSDYLQVYRNRNNFKKSLAEVRLRKNFNAQIEEIDSSEIVYLEPCLSEDYKFGYRIFDHGFTIDPEGLVKALFRLFQSYGGSFKKENIKQLVNDPKDKVTIIGEKTETCFGKVVIAAGAFSARILKGIVFNLPLGTERGYHITFPNSRTQLNRPVMEGDRKFLATPLKSGLRCAGTVEFAGLDAPPNPKRIEGIMMNAKRMFPGLDTSQGTTWMGCRPSFPDSLPVIGALKQNPNIVCAFGHQHVGLTSAPKTGKLIADLIFGRAPNDDISCFGVERFL